MANKKIYELEELTTPSANDLFVVNQASTSKDKKVKMQNLVPYDTMVSIITSILEAHPEWTTTVEDGSIDIDKLATDTLALINSKAETDGYYEDMAVGSAEQLLSNIFETDNTPYLYRTSGGTLEIGDRVYEDSIVGASVAWNQLLKMETASWRALQTSTINFANDTFSITNELGGTNFGLYLYADERFTITGHKYFISADVVSSSAGNMAVGIESAYTTTTITANTKTRFSAIQSATGDKKSFVVYRLANSALNDTMEISKLQCYDLTLALGSTIADYVNTLESGTAGAGIAWLKSQGFFGKDYYSYNAGGIESVKTSAKKVVGFNQWDEEWENGAFNTTTGANIASSTTIRAKNYIDILPNTTYHVKNPTTAWVLFFDEGKNPLTYYVSSLHDGNSSTILNSTFITPANARYMRFYVTSQYGTTYKNDICINFHWDGERDGEYEPYVEHTYPLDSDLELRGIPKLVDGKIKYDGDTYESDGSVTRKYSTPLDLGTLSWAISNSGKFFYASVSGIKQVVSLSVCNIICTKYTTINSLNTSQMDDAADKTITIRTSASQIMIKDTTYTDAATFKTAMSGVMLVYELATPTTESADPYTNPQLVDNWGTEEFVDTRDVPIPVGHESRYLPDLKAKLESAPNNPSTNGKYFLQYQNGEATYVPVPSEVPQTPSEDGTYVLKATVSSGTATLSWVAEE